MVVAETLPSGLRLVTESMPQVRSVTVGVWLTRGSRHESEAESGIAHFVEHMLFKGTTARSARQIAQEIDSIGGQLDAFTAKEYASYYIKVLDEHLPMALDLLSDLVLRPAFAPDDIVREQGVILEEIKMVEDAPDDLVHEVFAQQCWPTHPLGRPILGIAGDRVCRSGRLACATTSAARTWRRICSSRRPVTSTTRGCAISWRRRLPTCRLAPPRRRTRRLRCRPAWPIARRTSSRVIVCLGTPAYHQAHDDRHALYVLNTILGGSMSSRLFQHIREDRGLAYAVFSNLTTYTDTGMMTVYAGCANERVAEVVDLSLAEMRGLARDRGAGRSSCAGRRTT